MKALTEPQHRVLGFLESFAGRTGYPPTLEEIGEAIGLSNVSAVRGHLVALEKKGYITRVPDKARSIRIIHRPSSLSRLKEKLHQVLRTDEGVLHHVVYGLAWLTWRRTTFLSGPRRGWVSEALESECTEHGWGLLEKRIGPDHVVVVVKTWPNHSPELVVGRFKAAGDAVRRRHPGEFHGPSLWERGYAVTTDIELLGGLLDELRDEQASKRRGSDAARPSPGASQ